MVPVVGWGPIHWLIHRCYFNIIPKQTGEEDKDYIKRVAQIKDTIAEEVKKAKQLYNNPNFKTNCLLSKPFLYDGMALDEIS